MVQLPLDYLNLILAVLLPMATALITARWSHSAVKAIVLVALTVIGVLLQGVFDDGGILHTKTFIYQCVFQFLLNVGSHFGLLKPLSVTGSAGLVQSAVPAGIGGPGDRPGNVSEYSNN